MSEPTLEEARAKAGRIEDFFERVYENPFDLDEFCDEQFESTISKATDERLEIATVNAIASDLTVTHEAIGNYYILTEYIRRKEQEGTDGS